MNEYVGDAMYHLKRAAGLLSERMASAEVQDAVMQFAFGVEKMFKGIVAHVNPLFVYEAAGFDNALGVLYRDRLIPKHREKVAKEDAKPNGFNRSVLPFKASMLRAAQFSQVVEDNLGAFTKLSDFRGAVAHRPLADLNHDDAQRLLLRLFQPVVDAFAAELKLDADKCYAKNRSELADLSAKFVALENLKQRLESLFATHRAAWEKNMGNAKYVAKAEADTAAAFKSDPRSERHAEDHDCPACHNRAILWIEADWDVEGSSGPGYITGVYVSGLECRYCGLSLTDYEEFDYLRLNDRLADDEPDRD